MHIGKGSQESVSDITDRGKETYVITSRSVSKTRYLKGLMEKLPNAELLEFVTQHSPIDEITKIGGHLSSNNVKYIITAGGGSVIDAGKIARNNVDVGITQIAIPTTLSAAEFSHIGGYSEGREKKGIRKKELVPKYIYLDPNATAETPKELWRSTGLRSIDHAVESTLGGGFLEFRINMAYQSLTKMIKNIGGEGDEERLQCQIASWYSYMNVYDSPMGFSHQIGKIIGARWNVPHGITSCITLPEILRYYSLDPPEGLSSLSSLITGEEGKKGISSLADIIENLIRGLELERKLSDYGIKMEDIDGIYEKLGKRDNNLREAIFKML
ncbi:MAG: iron-containing alcohol dehydrogenase [Thermoplasmatales archaeon]